MKSPQIQMLQGTQGQGSVSSQHEEELKEGEKQEKTESDDKATNDINKNNTHKSTVAGDNNNETTQENHLESS